MTRATSAVYLFACLMGLAAPSAANAQQLPDTNGRVGPEAAAPMAVPSSPATACLQLHNGGAVFNFNVNINADVYPYTITGGTITGSICQAPWTVTGGSLGATLVINGQRTPVSGCSTTVAVVGNFNNPSSYIGTYGFNGSSTMFDHHTLFLGYDRPTCP